MTYEVKTLTLPHAPDPKQVVGKYFTRYTLTGGPVAICRIVGVSGCVLHFIDLGTLGIILYLLRKRQAVLVVSVLYEALAMRAQQRFPDWVSVW